MTPERWRQIDELVAAALELGANQRDVFLARVCAGDNALRLEVESLIAANEKAEVKDFLGAAAAANWGELLTSEQPTKAMLGKPTSLNERYLIERELGHGGMGVVYLARDQKLHSKYVVVKVLHEGNGRNDFWKQRFFREIEALARFENPHIVSILDKGELPDRNPFFVMEYLEGSNLRSVMKRESLSLARVASLMRQSSHAISYAHERAVFHRDLKPENIMLRSAGDEDFVIIIDFGIATVKELRPAVRDAGTVVSGTPPYMAPEQLMGEPSAASDIWALGVLACEMLTERLPFELPCGDRWLPQLYEMQKTGVKVKPKEFRPDLPEAAQVAILKALSFDPKDRHSQARDFGDELAASLMGKQSVRPSLRTTQMLMPAVQEEATETTSVVREQQRFAEVVISYAAQDLSRALQIADDLRAAGISCWMADHGHEINVNDRSETTEAIQHCTVVLLLCSDVSLRSTLVKQDMQLAWSCERPFLPLLVEPISFVEQAEYWLESKQWIEVMDASPERWMPQVLWSLAKSGIQLNSANLPTLRPESVVQPIRLNQSLQSLRSIARFTDQIWPIPAERMRRSTTDSVIRGLGAPQDDAQHGHRLGSRVGLVIESDRAGHLLLLDEGPEGVIYCLCPSWFAPDTRLQPGRSYFPQIGSRYDSFLVTGKPGREHLLALVSDELLGVDWLPTDPKRPAKILKEEDINALLRRLRALDSNSWTALSTYFDVFD